MVRLEQVAAAAGVSKSTASRVLTGDRSARIAAATRERVTRVAKGLDYSPDHRARALRVARSGAFALVVPKVNNIVFADLYQGVQDAVIDTDIMVLLSQIDWPPRGRVQLRELVSKGRVDGILMQRPEDFDDDALANVLATPNLPAVLVNSRLPGRPGSVTMDDAAAAAVATNHLITLGHKHIGHIAGVHVHDTARRRHEGFKRAMHVAGLPVRPEWTVRMGWEARAGSEGMMRLLDATSRPTAIVVSSANAAVGAAAAASYAGIKVPQELSIVGILDTWVAATFVPPLTVVRMPLRAVGHLATQMLMGRLSGEPLVDRTLTDYPPDLVIRGSTSSPPRR